MLNSDKKPDSASLIVKLNFLILGLGLTLYFMYGVNRHGVPRPLLSVLGISGPPKADLKLCKTRVQGVIEPDKLKLAQEGDSWVTDGPASHKVDFISVEKWLSRFCSAELTPVANTAKADVGAGFTPTLLIKFIDGGVDVLRSAADGRFEWHGQIFKSEELKSTLHDLETLPAAGKTN